MKRHFLLLLMIALLAFSTGCRKPVETPVGNFEASLDQGSFTVQDMRDAIFKGCADKTWRAVDRDANTIEATLIHGKHAVTVSIPYTATSYSINYKDGTKKLRQKVSSDGTPSVHSSYNRWVKNLDQAIRMRITPKQK